MHHDQTWHDNLLADLVVAGLAERTQAAYLRAVRQLSAFYDGRSPADLTEQLVRDYLLWMRTEKRAADGTLKIAIGGLRFAEDDVPVSASDEYRGIRPEGPAAITWTDASDSIKAIAVGRATPDFNKGIRDCAFLRPIFNKNFTTVESG